MTERGVLRCEQALHAVALQGEVHLHARFHGVQLDHALPLRHGFVNPVLKPDRLHPRQNRLAGEVGEDTVEAVIHQLNRAAGTAGAEQGHGQKGAADQLGVGTFHKVHILFDLAEIFVGRFPVVGGEGEGERGRPAQIGGGGKPADKRHPVAGGAVRLGGGVQAQGVGTAADRTRLQFTDGQGVQPVGNFRPRGGCGVGKIQQGMPILQEQAATGDRVSGNGNIHMYHPLSCY